MDVTQLLGALLTAVTYVTLLAILVSRSERLKESWRLALACSITTTWSLFAVYAAAPSTLRFGLELARDVSWMAAVFEVGALRAFRGAALVSAAIAITLLFVSAALALLNYPVIGAELPAALTIRTHLLSAMLGLVVIEQVHRNSRAATSSSARPLFIAAAGLFGYDLFLYSMAELEHGVSHTAYALRGFAWAAASIPVGLFAIRRGAARYDLAPSQRVMFYTAAMTAAGLYFCAVAVSGYALRSFGGRHGEWLQLVLVMGAALVVIALLFSQELRGRAKVAIAKHLYRQKYDYRAEWLRFNDTMSASGQPVYETAVRAVAQAIGSDAGFVFVADGDLRAIGYRGQWSATDAAQRKEGLLLTDDTVAQLKKGWILDTETDRGAAGDQLAGAYIISPILQGDELRGAFALRKPPAFELSYEDRDLLITLGRQVAMQFAQHEASQRLADNRQLEAFARMSVFLIHDLKNSAAQLALIVSNAQKHKSNPRFIDDAIRTSDNVVQRIRRVIEHLQPQREPRRRQRVCLSDVIATAIERCSSALPVPRAENVARVQVEAEPATLTAVLEHILRNAQDATPDSGRVSVNVSEQHGKAILSIEDTGEGMSDDFIRERLFRPFETTKGAAGMGIGAYQAREHIRDMGGSVEVRSEQGLGTRFCISLPIANVLERES